jgi:hypothetical protein
MLFSSWLRKHNATPRTNRRPNSTFRPQLEVLEGRALPSTLTVTNLNDSGHGSLRHEIAEALSGDTIVFAKKLDGGTITLSSGNELQIGKNLTIQGPGANLLTVSSGPYYVNKTRIFEIDSATVTLSGLRIINGGGHASIYGDYSYDGWGGGILNRDGTLTVSGCTLYNNSAVYGGGIYNAGTLTVSSCGLFSNSAENDGGGILNAYGTVTVSVCTLSGNSAVSGGGIYNYGTVTVSVCTLSGNYAYSGGGIYNAGTAGALTVLNSIFSSNTPDNINGPYTDGGGNTFS